MSADWQIKSNTKNITREIPKSIAVYYGITVLWNSIENISWRSSIYKKVILFLKFFIILFQPGINKKQGFIFDVTNNDFHQNLRGKYHKGSLEHFLENLFIDLIPF